jgi:hypothetical protein
MDLTRGQQRLVFVVIVIALVGLGFYLIGHRQSGSGTPAASSSASASASQPPASATASAGVPPSVVPSATPVSTAGGAEIYQWLPFTPADLATAASVTTRFAAAYATWSYTENKAAYGAKLSPLVTAQELSTLEYDYSTSGVAGPRTADKQVSTGSGTIDAISSFGTGTITFTVAISQQVTSTQPTSTVHGQYTVTVESAAGGWQVNSIELSSLGNTGNS